jgi:hypothetical protein
MTIFWHVDSGSYKSGMDLRCWNDLLEAGVLTEDDWKWDGADPGFDGDVIALHPDTDLGREMRDEHLSEHGGIVLRINIPSDALQERNNGLYIEKAEIEMDTADDGQFPAVRRCIPASYIKEYTR